jgi:hypothetical protein
MSTTVKLQQSSSTQQPLWWKEGKIFKVLFTITVANTNSGANANPYVAGGDTLDLTQLFNTNSSAPGELLPTFEGVAKVVIQSNRGTLGTGYAGLFQYGYAPGTTLANGTLQVFTGAAAQAALTELTAGTYPANVLNDVIQGEAYFVMP